MVLLAVIKKKKKDSSDWIGAYLTHRVMDTREMRGHESMREMCFLQKQREFYKSCLCEIVGHFGGRLSSELQGI